eukprot:TRINITY_DN13820_c0_g1_i13.p1 TRINITY_DN13820_c0_g1~~TRINITY_DN13820_c0_g1_i13.p1  ORF type:complete len:1102 (-),score=169.02 TRINITY_DN13820_c0_g1_i13:475-3780(-)
MQIEDTCGMSITDVATAFECLVLQNDARAGQWLLQFQQSSQAWQVTNDILAAVDCAGSQLASQLQVFAAQSLRIKIRTNLEELAPGEQAGLKEALIHHLLRYAKGNRQVLTQLCLAVSALLLRSPSVVGAGKDGIFSGGGIAAGLKSGPGVAEGQDDAWNTVLLELLTVLPEETMDARSVACVRWERRQEFERELLDLSAQVLQLLGQEAVKESVSSRMAARLGCFSQQDLQNDGHLHPLLLFPLQCLAVGPLAESAAEVLETVLLGSPPELALALFSPVTRLCEDVFLPSIEAGNEEITQPFCQLLTDMITAAPRQMLGGSIPVASPLISAMLLCASRQGDDWAMCEATLPFWSAVSEALLSLKETPLTTSLNSPSSAADETAIAANIGSKVLQALIARASLRVEDIAGAVHQESLCPMPEELETFRRQLKENLQELHHLLGSSQYIFQCSPFVREERPLETGTWLRAESYLFALGAVGSQLFEQRDSVSSTSQIVEGILYFIASVMFPPEGSHGPPPGLQLSLRQTCASLVGVFSPSLVLLNGRGGRGANVAMSHIVWLHQGLSQPAIASSCAWALRSICEATAAAREDGSPIDSQQERLLVQELLKAVQVGHTACHNPATSLQQIEDTGDSDLGAALRALLPLLSGDIDGLQWQLLAPALATLQSLAASYQSIPSVEANDGKRNGIKSSQNLKRQGVQALIRVGSFLGPAASQSLTWDSPKLLKECWPLLEQLLRGACEQKGAEDIEITEATCRCITDAMMQTSSEEQLVTTNTRGFPDDLLSVILEVLVVCFCKRPEAAYLHAVDVIIRERGLLERQPPSALLAARALASIVTAPTALEFLTVSGCDARPDVAAAFMALGTTFTTCAAPEVLQFVAQEQHIVPGTSICLLSHWLQRAAVCCTAAHRTPSGAALSFISLLLTKAVSTLIGPLNVSARSPSNAGAHSVAHRCVEAGPWLVAGVVRSLLGPGAVSRVHKAASILQHLAALLVGLGRLEGVVDGASSCTALMVWITAALQESLGARAAEVPSLVRAWGPALCGAGEKCLADMAAENKGGIDVVSEAPLSRTQGGGGGEGARVLKRCLHEFSSAHRFSLTPR